MSLTLLFDSFFFQAASGPSVFTYFAQSNFAGKIVVLILVACSLLAWTVMIGKGMELRKLRTLNARYQRALAKEAHLLALESTRPGKGSGPYYCIVGEALGAFFRYGGDTIHVDTHRASLRMGHVENALQRAVAEQIITYESKMVMLGSIVTGAPFLGLFGTVWGVMDAFGGMAGSGAASLQSLAPGVSGALLTTVAGLFVAIPSVFGYNFLLQNTKIAVVELENFASTVADRIELEAQAVTQED
jgi:biopolymer transport protein TolQ